jgi:hypothetical protein
MHRVRRSFTTVLSPLTVLRPAAVLAVVLTPTVVLALAVDRAVVLSRRRGDRGDVPGWVLVTLMTAGLVTTLWVLARERLTEVFDRAITSVTG